MKNGRLQQLENQFIKTYGDCIGVMRLSEFNRFCNTHGVIGFDRTTLQYRLYNNEIADVQFDAHIDALKSQA